MFLMVQIIGIRFFVLCRIKKKKILRIIRFLISYNLWSGCTELNACFLVQCSTLLLSYYLVTIAIKPCAVSTLSERGWRMQVRAYGTQVPIKQSAHDRFQHKILSFLSSLTDILNSFTKPIKTGDFFNSYFSFSLSAKLHKFLSNFSEVDNLKLFQQR